MKVSVVDGVSSVVEISATSKNPPTTATSTNASTTSTNASTTRHTVEFFLSFRDSVVGMRGQGVHRFDHTVYHFMIQLCNGTCANELNPQV